MNIIDPLKNKAVLFSISLSSVDENEHKIGAVVYSGENQLSKLSMIFVNQ
jgi:hypothetical protein